MTTPTPSQPSAPQPMRSKLPKATVRYLTRTRGDDSCWTECCYLGGIHNEKHYVPGDGALAVLPCATRKQAQQWVRLATDYPNLTELLQEVDRVLTLVPARDQRPGWMAVLHSEYVAPLVEKLRFPKGTK